MNGTHLRAPDNRDMDELARTLSLEHGKTLADARGDIQRGVEVIEFALGAPHLMKGEYSTDAGSGYLHWTTNPRE